MANATIRVQFGNADSDTAGHLSAEVDTLLWNLLDGTLQR